jgi:hypothetical protein
MRMQHPGRKQWWRKIRQDLAQNTPFRRGPGPSSAEAGSAQARDRRGDIKHSARQGHGPRRLGQLEVIDHRRIRAASADRRD